MFCGTLGSHVTSQKKNTTKIHNKCTTAYELQQLAEWSHDPTKEHVQCAATNVPMSLSSSLHAMLLPTMKNLMLLLTFSHLQKNHPAPPKHASNNWLRPSSPDMPRSAQQPRSPPQRINRCWHPPVFSSKMRPKSRNLLNSLLTGTLQCQLSFFAFLSICPDLQRIFLAQ